VSVVGVEKSDIDDLIANNVYTQAMIAHPALAISDAIGQRAVVGIRCAGGRQSRRRMESRFLSSSKR